MSNRWSYGPEGLRERPARRWWDAVLPHWRDVQPLLIRSAGVVGIVATIMAVVSSDAWRLGGTVQTGGRNDPPAETAVAGDKPALILASVSPEQSVEPVAKPAGAPPSSAAIEAAAAEPAAPVEPVAPIAPVAPIEVAAPELVASTEAEVAPPTAAVVQALSDLRTGRAPDPAAYASAPLTTASVSAAATVVSAAEAAPSPAVPEIRNSRAEVAATELRHSDPPPVATPAAPSAWVDGAKSCPRDWVAAGPVGAAADCTATEVLVASAAGPEHSALEAAAAEEALKLAALAPRVPAPRPDPPADAPKAQPVRLSRGSSWPGPPPNCPAGQHAKWHFVDRKAGTKEWYCR